MIAEEILNDYRNDWLCRCTKMDGFDYSRLNGQTVFFKNEDAPAEIIKSMKDIIAAIQSNLALDLHLSDQTDLFADVALIWNLNRSTAGAAVPIPNCKRLIYVTDQEPDHLENHPEGSIILYCGSLYGAGLDTPGTALENDCTNILDFLGSQLFLLAHHDHLPGGIYYSGHGKCSLPGVHILSSYGYQSLISYEDGNFMLEFSQNRPDERFYFDNTYQGNLYLLHDLLFQCLLEFDRICKKHHITYYLGGGTLLGAARHKGMIPWDDDMDVMMLRDDYNKFVSVVNDEINSDMFFQSPETDPEYHSIFTKIRLNGTKFVTEYSKQFSNMHQGIFIDIFVHDHTSNNKIGQKLHVFQTLFARSMVFNKWAGKPMHFYGRLKFICKLATRYIRKTPLSKLEKYQDKVVQKYNKKHTSYLYDGTGEHLRHGAFPAKWLDGVSYLKFNDRDFPVPKDYQNYLKYSYGDYETWIPASLRKAGHDIIEVDFGKYKKSSL